MAAIVSMGSLYFNGEAQAVGVSYNGETISFEDTVPGKEIQWVNVNGLLIADRCLCNNISWKQLNALGLVLGSIIRIDGEFYFCRCLKVGAKEGDPNEWDTALDVAGDSNELWHWDRQFFWGQETTNPTSYRGVRGYRPARRWYYFAASSRDVLVGFRPALETLGSEPCPPDTLIGKPARIYGPAGATLEGRLLDADDYDLVLQPTSMVPKGCPWAHWDGSRLTVDRASVSWLKGA